MKKIYLLILPLFVIMTSCSTGAAEKVAEEFHQKFDNDEIDYITENLLDTEASEEDKMSFSSFLKGIRSGGKPANRKKETGFSKKMNNGVSTVRLNYTFDLEGEKVYEGLVLIDRGEGYRILVVSMHPDKSVVDSFTKDY